MILINKKRVSFKANLEHFNVTYKSSAKRLKWQLSMVDQVRNSTGNERQTTYAMISFIDKLKYQRNPGHQLLRDYWD